ncbi:hypothetical protein AVI51_15385 [Piscirickettsia salmonis]|uniref:Uncharacterized protein n=1 Tax=Piscirickettsia salmonis TaxID=1238 RepID=A0A9Q6PXP0_PISSA|nr:hypothetical protein [Piscirickettsia salmonis]ALA24415.1 pentapeptide repeats family protein [Piscirickettsia salmonis]APS44780.1 hypothetical protein AVI48_10670 [Piscirickettsia salmonis]APS48139.1 hypothetical protein AVI49_11275 [Piscirickettsia salmonis]APS52094.1 hypothetical protein AVI50_15535 [Piscirickettsia salmonis]APS55314.1 hypothetical protein AVI51_15385 [Piscirickettsia salmonis]
MPFENEFNHKPDLETLLDDTLAGHERGESVQFGKVFELRERIRADDRIGKNLAILYVTYLLAIFSLPSSVDTDMMERIREVANHHVLAPQLFFGEGAERGVLSSREGFMAAVMRRYDTGVWPEGIGQLNLVDSIPDPEYYFTLEEPVLDSEEELEPEPEPESAAPAEVLAYLNSFVAIDQDRIFPIPPALTEHLPAEEYAQFLEKRSDLLKCPISLDSIDVPVTVGGETQAYDRDGLHRWLSSHDRTPVGRTCVREIPLESIRNGYSPKLFEQQYGDIVRGSMEKLPEAVREQAGDRRPELLFHDHQPEEGGSVAQERHEDMSPT